MSQNHSFHLLDVNQNPQSVVYLVESTSTPQSQLSLISSPSKRRYRPVIPYYYTVAFPSIRSRSYPLSQTKSVSCHCYSSHPKSLFAWKSVLFARRYKYTRLLAFFVCVCGNYKCYFTLYCVEPDRNGQVPIRLPRNEWNIISVDSWMLIALRTATMTALWLHVRRSSLAWLIYCPSQQVSPCV